MEWRQLSDWFECQIVRFYRTRDKQNKKPVAMWLRLTHEQNYIPEDNLYLIKVYLDNTKKKWDTSLPKFKKKTTIKKECKSKNSVNNSNDFRRNASEGNAKTKQWNNLSLENQMTSLMHMLNRNNGQLNDSERGKKQ